MPVVEHMKCILETMRPHFKQHRVFQLFQSHIISNLSMPGRHTISNTIICNSALSEILALIALRAKDKILKRNRGVMLENLQKLEAFMKRHQELLSWVPPKVALWLF